MLKTVAIYKEKKSERVIILPSGRDKIGLIQYKDYGIVSYIRDIVKMGEIILWALNESDEKIIEEEVKVPFEKQFFNRSSYRKVTIDYNLVSFDFFEEKYEIILNKRDGKGYSEFRDKNNEKKIYIFDELPTTLELGTKVMELFEFKEKYDEENGL